MKHLKRFASLLLALTMVFALATTVSAYTIKLENGETSPVTGHTYSVYQIFTGDLSEDETTLSNVKYGANYTGSEDDTKTGDLVPAAELEAITDARAFAESLMANNHALLKGDAFGTLDAEHSWTITDVPAGYYLIVDEGVPAAGDSYSAYIIQVVDDVTMKPKSETVPVDKDITGDDNEITGDIAGDGKSDNVSIGSTVTYTLTTKIPANAENYDYYYFIIGDTLSDGLTFNDDSVEVTIGGQKVAAGTDYTLFTGDDADDKTFQIALLDAKAHAGEEVVVTYTATLNKNAVIGAEGGNTNDFDVTYSNDPNYDYDGTDNDNDGKPDKDGEGDEDQGVPMGTTPVITTRTYTTGIKLMKVDENDNPLQGAEFEITGSNVKIVLVSGEVFGVDENGEYWKLKDGTYTTEAPQTEDEYVVKTGDRDGGYVLVDGEYREATADELAGDVTLYKLLKANSGLYASTETKYSKTVVLRQESGGQTETDVKAYVGTDGILVFEGLGEGEYTITETTTPDGYNTIAPITVKIDWEAPATASNDCTWTATVKGTDEQLILNADGVFELEVVNVPGSLLPETGGMGTTIFYVLGSVLVIGAVVLLVTKKRMNAET